MNRRRAWRIAMWLGEGVAYLGGAATVVGAVLPWAVFKLFAMPVVLPGILLQGSLSAAAAAAAISVLRRMPLLSVLLGICAFAVAVWAHQTLGFEVRAALLRIDMAFTPVNSRLAQVGLGSIDPAPSIGPGVSFLGAGITWTLIGATVLTAGALLRIVAERLSRSCDHCGKVWRASRFAELHFCPSCGYAVMPVGGRECRVCRRPIFRREKFCGNCGTHTAAEDASLPVPSR